MQARAQRVISSLSENSLIRAKRENGTKHNIEVNEPFLSLE